MKDGTMFPYRRGNKKRGKGGGGLGPAVGAGNGAGMGGGMPRRNGPGGGNPGNGGRRVAGSAQELLPMLQPTTKALAQVLAGNVRASGQIANARNIVSQAQWLIDDRQIDRLNPMHREEFLEQVARLKLTLADAEAALEDAADAPVRAPPPVVSIERLRALALSIATSTSEAAANLLRPPEPATVEPTPPEAAAEAAEEPKVAPLPRVDIPEGSVRSARLRLNTERRTAKPEA